MPLPVVTRAQPFGPMRGVEYGQPHQIKDAILLSYMSIIMDQIVRTERMENRKWRRAAERWMSDISPNGRWMYGSPMQHGITSYLDFVKQMRGYAKVVKERFPTGVDYGIRHPLDKEMPSFDGKELTWLLYEGGPRNYNTLLSQVGEHAVPVSKGERIIEMLIDMVGHDDFDTAPPEVQEIIQKLTNEAAMKKRLMIVKRWAWLPSGEHPEMAEAHEYHDECLKYQASAAGKKAKRLLLENLTEQQTDDYFNKGYFFVVPPQKDKPIEKRRIYVVERSFPNGNVMRVRQKTSRGGRRLWYPVENFCYHTEDPHAIDDILLAQKLMMENHEEEFRKVANISSPWYAGRAPLEIVKRGF